jgi:hypothetical protein
MFRLDIPFSSAIFKEGAGLGGGRNNLFFRTPSIPLLTTINPSILQMQTLRAAPVLQFAVRKNINNRDLHGKMLAQVLILVLYRLDHPSKKELMTCPHSNRGSPT